MSTKQTRRKDQGLPDNGGRFAATEHAEADASVELGQPVRKARVANALPPRTPLSTVEPLAQDTDSLVRYAQGENPDLRPDLAEVIDEYDLRWETVNRVKSLGYGGDKILQALDGESVELIGDSVVRFVNDHPDEVKAALKENQYGNGGYTQSLLATDYAWARLQGEDDEHDAPEPIRKLRALASLEPKLEVVAGKRGIGHVEERPLTIDDPDMQALSGTFPHLDGAVLEFLDGARRKIWVQSSVNGNYVQLVNPKNDEKIFDIRNHGTFRVAEHQSDPQRIHDELTYLKVQSEYLYSSQQFGDAERFAETTVEDLDRLAKEETNAGARAYVARNELQRKYRTRQF